MLRRINIVAFDGCQALDVFSPDARSTARAVTMPVFAVEPWVTRGS